MHENPVILSTKKLLPYQRDRLVQAGLRVLMYDAIRIVPCIFSVNGLHKNAIITSQNTLKMLRQSNQWVQVQSKIEYVYAVGEKTSELAKSLGFKVVYKGNNANELAQYIAEHTNHSQFTFLCGQSRREELPEILKQNKIQCKEIIVYQTLNNTRNWSRSFAGILFYSPSGVQSYLADNYTYLKEDTKVFCIGNTTAQEAAKHTKNVIIANTTTIDSVIAKACYTFNQKQIRD